MSQALGLHPWKQANKQTSIHAMVPSISQFPTCSACLRRCLSASCAIRSCSMAFLRSCASLMLADTSCCRAITAARCSARRCSPGARQCTQGRACMMRVLAVWGVRECFIRGALLLHCVKRQCCNERVVESRDRLAASIKVVEVVRSLGVLGPSPSSSLCSSSAFRSWVFSVLMKITSSTWERALCRSKNQCRPVENANVLAHAYMPAGLHT